MKIWIGFFALVAALWLKQRWDATDTWIETHPQ
jgi:hypothetical protein